ncbi:MAG TPA: rod shape-determining protein MreC [Candidatus Doudnabacteria bacterium]|nr:rod shape-determining protein MreC [Candidatus Doudnabacteria bacterium]
MRFIYTKTFLIFSAILVAILIALIMQSRGWFAPLEYALLQLPRPAITAVNAVIIPINTVITTITGLPALVAENNSLTTENSELKRQQVALEQLRIENELLKAELDFVSRFPYSLQPCTVLSLDPQNTTDAIILNCGESTGIKVGQGVVSEGYLIAKVVHVGNFNSTAILITNNQSSVDAKVAKNDSEGVVKGSFGSGLIFDLVSQSAEVEAGDLIVTAGINPQIPRNLLIGQADQTLSGDNDLFKRLTLLSPIKAHRLDYVFVVKP